jgi:hypothetical protein
MQEDLFVARAPGRLDVMGGIADGTLTTQPDSILKRIKCQAKFGEGSFCVIIYELSSILCEP